MKRKSLFNVLAAWSLVLVMAALLINPLVAGANGGGIFVDSGQSLGDSQSIGIALGDVDGDGDLDAFVANQSWQANKVWLNDGTGAFSDSGQSLGGAFSYAVALGDMDGDGDLDAFVVNYWNEPDRVWMNDGGVQGGTLGTFSDSGQSLGNSPFGNQVVLEDIDDDGDLDAFVTCHGYPNKVWWNDGVGTLSDGQSLGSSHSADMAFGDVDADGDLDAFVANSHDNIGEANRVWLNDALGTLSDSGQSLGSAPSTGIALGDLDGDSDLDAFVANSGAPVPNRVWWNDGGVQGGTLGIFSDSGQSLGSLPSRRVALGDFDSDGDLDAFVVNYDDLGQPNKVWLNDGTGIFSEGQSLGNSYSTGLALGDVDGDGDLDAFVANAVYDQANRVWLNTTDPNRPPTANANGPYSVLEGDTVQLDGEGSSDPDLGDTLAYAWDLDDDGTFETPGAAPIFAGVDGPSEHLVTLRVCDSCDVCDTDLTTVQVVNVAPTPSIDGLAEGEEGCAITLVGSASDPAGDSDTIGLTWSVTKDGQAYASGTGAEIEFTPDDNGTYEVMLVADDEDGGSSSTNHTVLIDNVDPVVSIDTVSDETGSAIGVDVDAILVGLTVEVAGSFSDAGTVDIHTATIGWGDGTPVDQLGSVTGEMYGSHVYESAGSFVISLEVADDDNSSGTASAVIEVAEPADTTNESIEDLTELATEPELEPEAVAAIEDALDGLAGSQDGEGDNGVLDKLEEGDVNSAMSKLQKVLEDLDLADAADETLDLATVQAQLVLTAKALAVDAIAEAGDVAASPGELKQVQRAEELLAEGDSSLSAGDYSAALDGYQAAWKRATAILP